MIRLLIFILSVCFLAGVVTFLTFMEGRVAGELFRFRFDAPSGVVFGLLLFVAACLVLGTAWLKELMALPGKLKARENEAKRARGVVALTRGIEAVAVGDAGGAQHFARIAQKNLEDAGLTRLLTAQAAQLAGDEASAKESFSAMLASPESEFLGLRGLYIQAMRAGDKEQARGYAERAFKLRNNAGWAFDSVLELGLERGAWRETRAAVEIAAKNKLLPAEHARRAEAALYAADAYAADAGGDHAVALADAEASLKLAPGFAPAAVLAARRHAAEGRRGRGAKILERAFAETPHPALVITHMELYADQPAEKRADQLRRIAERRPSAREAQLALARRHILLGEHREAASILERLLKETAGARECLLMAAAMSGVGGESAARPWLERAAASPRESDPGVDGVFHLTRQGWASLVREYKEHARLAPPPLEDFPRGLSEQDFIALAPPAPAAPSVALAAAPKEGDTAKSAEPPSDERAAENLQKAAEERERAVIAAREVS